MVESRSALTSLTIHVAALLLLFGLMSQSVVTIPLTHTHTLHLPLRPPLLKPNLSHSGGGGQQAKLEASAGHLPKVSPRQFVPPMPVVNLQPKLVMVATIEAPSNMPDLKLPNAGDPTGLGALASAGRGGPGGYGDGKGTGVGSSNGAGAGMNVYHAGVGITLPVPIKKVEPEFSEEARRAHANGMVVVYCEVGADGKPHNIRVTHGFGMGLDEKAMEAVAQWLFRPGTKNGKAVTVAANIEVSFRLL